MSLIYVEQWANGSRDVAHLHAGGLCRLGQQHLSRGDISQGLGKLKATAGTSGRLSIGNAEKSVHEGAIVQLYRLSDQGARGGSGEDGVRVNGGRLAADAGTGESQCKGK